MRVAVALKEAKAARNLLDGLGGSWLEELSEVLALIQAVHGEFSDGGAMAHAITNDIERRLLRITTSGRQKVESLNPGHSFATPLSTEFIHLSEVSLEMLNSVSGLSEAMAYVSSEITKNALEEAKEQVRRFDIANSEAGVYVRAWLAFADDRDDNSHQITLTSVGHASHSISNVIAWLELLDVMLAVAAAGTGDRDMADGITIERIESGSIVAWFKNVPDEVWDMVVELWSRVTNPELTQIGNVVAATNMLMVVAEATAKINRLKKSADLTPEQADLLLDRLRGLPDRGLPDETQVFVTEVDGESLAKSPLAQLPPPENGTGEVVEAETDGAGSSGGQVRIEPNEEGSAPEP